MSSRVMSTGARRRTAILAALLAAVVLGGCTQESGAVPDPETPILPVEDGGGGY
jgi:FlaG/FlaF family flagellin (archaellin)